jgi:hypothetical protein
VTLPGCLGEPEIEERWTRLDVDDLETLGDQPAGTGVEIHVQGEVVYRSILTGAIVAEVRIGNGITPPTFDPEAPRLEMLDAVDRVLASSTSAGFGVMMVTGWDHLIQDIDITFTADIPADPGSGGCYLLVYMADAEEVELPTGEEILVITPFDHTATEVLPLGVRVIPGAGGP